MSRAIDKVSIPPPGRGPAVAAFRPPTAEFAKGITAVIVVYAVISGLYVLASPGQWWVVALITVPCYALSLLGATGETVAVGEDWLKVPRSWVDISQLTEVRYDNTGSRTMLKLRDTAGRTLSVDSDVLRRSAAVRAAFANGLERSQASLASAGLRSATPDPPGAARRAAAALRAGQTSHLVIEAALLLPVGVAALVSSELHTIGLAADRPALRLAFGVSVLAGALTYAAWPAWSGRPRPGQAPGPAARAMAWGHRHRVSISVVVVIVAVLLHADHGANEAVSIGSGIVLGALAGVEARLVQRLGVMVLRRRTAGRQQA